MGWNSEGWDGRWDAGCCDWRKTYDRRKRTMIDSSKSIYCWTETCMSVTKTTATDRLTGGWRIISSLCLTPCRQWSDDLAPGGSLPLRLIIIIIYLPNNTTVYTFAWIRFRRAGQQGPIRTLTAALKRSIKTVTGCIYYHTNKIITNEKN